MIMPKRFTESNKWEDTWFMNLPNTHKLFWIFLLDRCDNAGIWEVNYKIANFYIGENLEPSEIKRIFQERIVEVEGGKYWFIPKFITFQYGEKLSRENLALKNVIKKLDKYNLFNYVKNLQIIEGAIKELRSPYKGAKDKDKDKDKEEDKEKSKSSRFAPPSLDEVKSYIKLNKYQVDAEQFIDFYTTKGWMVGRNKMKDWQAAVRTWAKRNKETAKPTGRVIEPDDWRKPIEEAKRRIKEQGTIQPGSLISDYKKGMEE